MSKWGQVPPFFIFPISRLCAVLIQTRRRLMNRRKYKSISAENTNKKKVAVSSNVEGYRGKKGEGRGLVLIDKYNE